MQDSQGGGESDPAEGVRRRCMKYSPSAPMSRHLNVVVRFPPLYLSGPKWRDNYPKGLDHLVAPLSYFIVGKGIGRKFSRKGGWKKQDQKIVSLSSIYFISIMNENPGGHAPCRCS